MSVCKAERNGIDLRLVVDLGDGLISNWWLIGCFAFVDIFLFYFGTFFFSLCSFASFSFRCSISIFTDNRKKKLNKDKQRQSRNKDERKQEIKPFYLLSLSFFQPSP